MHIPVIASSDRIAIEESIIYNNALFTFISTNEDKIRLDKVNLETDVFNSYLSDNYDFAFKNPDDWLIYGNSQKIAVISNIDTGFLELVSALIVYDSTLNEKGRYYFPDSHWFTSTCATNKGDSLIIYSGRSNAYYRWIFYPNNTLLSVDSILISEPLLSTITPYIISNCILFQSNDSLYVWTFDDTFQISSFYSYNLINKILYQTPFYDTYSDFTVLTFPRQLGLTPNSFSLEIFATAFGNDTLWHKAIDYSTENYKAILPTITHLNSDSLFHYTLIYDNIENLQLQILILNSLSGTILDSIVININEIIETESQSEMLFDPSTDRLLIFLPNPIVIDSSVILEFDKKGNILKINTLDTGNFYIINYFKFFQYNDAFISINKTYPSWPYLTYEITQYDRFDGTELLGSLEFSGIIIFPNPVSDYISIQGIQNPTTLHIFDINGWIIQTDILPPQSEIKYSLSNLSTGVYVLQFINENGMFTEKLIKY